MQTLTYPGYGVGYPVGSDVRGAILAALFSAKLSTPNVKVCHIKKEGENSHSSYPDYFYRATLPNNAKLVNVIIDDFIATGETMRNIYTKLSGFTKEKVDCLIAGSLDCQEESDLNDSIGFIPSYVITNKI